MDNRTNYKVPKKYQSMVSMIVKDQDGVWIYLHTDYINDVTGCSTIHETSYKECLEQLRYNVEKKVR